MGAILKKFGRKVRKLRQEQGLSQEELAAKVGLHYTYIGSVERGEANLTLKNIEKIADALGIGRSFSLFMLLKRPRSPYGRLRASYLI